MANKTVSVKAVPHDGFTTRRRAGKEFGAEFSEPFEVDEAGYQSLLDDPYLQVREGGQAPKQGATGPVKTQQADQPNEPGSDLKRK